MANSNLISTLGRLFLVLTIQIISLNGFAQCPNIQLVDVRGIPGYPDLDNLIMCNDADTLSVLVFTDEPGTIRGFELQLNLLPGMEFAGFVDAQNPSTTVSVIDPDPMSPKFLLNLVGEEDIMVANIGIKAICGADIRSIEYLPTFIYSYTFIDTLGNVFNCSGSDVFDLDMNNAIKEPILNFGVTDNWRPHKIGDVVCENVRISQNGLSAKLDSFRLTVCGFDWGAGVNFHGIWAGLNTNVNAYEMTPNVTFSPDSMELSVLVDGPAFDSHGASNDNGDFIFDEDEELRMTLCYIIAQCPETEGTVPFSYKASWGCQEDRCNVQVLDKNFFVTVRNYPEPVVSSSLSQPLVLCSQPALIDLTLSSDVPDPVGGSFRNLKFGYESCPTTNLEMVSFKIAGTALPAGSFYSQNGDLVIDLTTLTFDPDGAGIGIEDTDGDGFFDDLPGGNTLMGQLEIDLVCGIEVPEPNSIDCPIVDCDFGQFFVDLYRDCDDRYVTPVPQTSINIQAAAITFTLNETTIDPGVVGFEFPKSSDGANGVNPQQVTMNLCYELSYNNFTPCADSDMNLRFNLVAAPRQAEDLQILSATFDNGTGPVGIPNSKQFNPDGTVDFIFDGGDNSAGTTMCYSIVAEVDSCLCHPVMHGIGTFQLVESCNDCGSSCDYILACEQTVIRTDPECADCDCIVEVGTVENRRHNYGYTDKTKMSKIDQTSAYPDDLNRYIPGDTIYNETWVTISDTEVLENLYRVSFNWYINDGTLNSNSPRDRILSMDASNSEFLSMEIKKAGTPNRILIDLSNYSECFFTDEVNSVCSWPSSYTGLHPYGPNIATRRNAGIVNDNRTDIRDNNIVSLALNNNTYRDDNCGCLNRGDCLDAFINDIDWSAGDTIFIRQTMPVIKNLYAIANNEIPQPGVLNPYVDLQYKDLTTGLCYAPPEKSCLSTYPIEMFCPGEPTVKTNLNLDNCGGQVEHHFTLKDAIPDDWFVNEYRPLLDLWDIDIPIEGSLVYCGNAKIIDCLGNQELISSDSLSNLNCVNQSNETYCAVQSGNTGIIHFDLKNSNISTLGVGLGASFVDSITLEHDVCYLCPDLFEDYSSNQIVYDFKYRVLDPWRPTEGYRCSNVSSESPPLCGPGQSWFTLYNLDTVWVKEDRIGNVFFVESDNRTPMAALTSSLTTAGFLTSANPSVSIENQNFEVCVDGTDPTLPTHQNVTAMISVTNSVQLSTVTSGGAPLTFTLVSSTSTENIYSINLPDLNPGDCYNFDIGTTLLFCPVAPEPSPTICIAASSSCMDSSVQAALLGQSSQCQSTKKCYFYAFEPAEVQTEWIAPTEDDDFDLCGEIEFAVVIKNVRNPTLYNLILDWSLPLQGMQIVPGSFEISENNPGDMTLPFVNIPTDPTTTDNINYTYTNVADWSANIAANGFEGINTATPNGNRFVIKFKAITTCDEFLSGSTMDFETTASDPCSSDLLTSGKVESNPIIISGADPADNALVLNFATSEAVYCGGGSTEFSLAGVNISDYPIGDNVIMCFNFPSTVTYVPNSLVYVVPNGQPLGNVTSNTVGNFVQLCFDGPTNLGPDQQFAVKLEAMVDPTTACSDIELGVDIKTVIEAQPCSTQAEPCDVLVQNSLNDGVFIEVGPPLETVSLDVYQGCNPATGNIEICYNIELMNPAPVVYNSFVQIDLLDDLQNNAVVDGIDPILGTYTHASITILPNESIVISECIELQADMSCPILFNQTYDAACACDNWAVPISDLPPQFMAESDLLLTCPNEPVEVEICPNYSYTLSNSEAIAVVENGNMFEFTLNDGFGVDAPETITVTGGAGDCSNSFEISLLSTGDLELTPQPVDVCEGECAQLDLGIPFDLLPATTVSWSPTTGLDDPTSPMPIVCDITSSVIYTATVTFGESCTESVMIPVTYLPKGNISVTGFEVECIDMSNQPVFEATTGYDLYTWYEIVGSNEIPIVVTTINTLQWYTPGNYKVVASGGSFACPAESAVFNLTANFLPQVCLPVTVTKN